jgi:quercetin dioxygenase-like cupin family protein
VKIDDALRQGAPAAGLVTVAPASIVSRMLLKGAAGSVILFAFDSGQELSEHTVPHDAFIHVLEGEAEIRVAGEPRTMRAGDALILPGGIPHAVRALAPFKMYLVMVRA